jgi:hypothetical protein
MSRSVWAQCHQILQDLFDRVCVCVCGWVPTNKSKFQNEVFPCMPFPLTRPGCVRHARDPGEI